ncbi:hypothetical protein FDECE_4271 [Fusarium decemcellulare]|nr:hypothetical protein FDECE_4271 [Fusarium decemcellulare]
MFYFTAGSLLSGLISSVHRHDISAPGEISGPAPSKRSTDVSECVTTCARDLMQHFFTDSHHESMEILCNDMAKQRDLFLCLNSSCGDDYGPALAHSISECFDYGASITNLVPVELHQTSLARRQVSPIVPRVDTGRFSFKNKLTLAIDCMAGSDGVLTLSLPESVPSTVSLPNRGGDSPISPGAGPGDPNVGSDSPSGNSASNVGFQSEGSAALDGAESGLSADSVSAGFGGEGNPGNMGDGSFTGSDCDAQGNGTPNGPSGPQDNRPLDPNPVPTTFPEGSNFSPDGQTDGPPPYLPDSVASSQDATPGSLPVSSSPGSPCLDTGAGNTADNVPPGADQGVPGQPQAQPESQPVPASPAPNSNPPSPDEGSGSACQTNAQGPADENCRGTPSALGSGTPENALPGSSPPSYGSTIGCFPGTDNPACANQNQGPPGPSTPPQTILPPANENPEECPKKANGSPNCGAPLPLPAPPTSLPAEVSSSPTPPTTPDGCSGAPSNSNAQSSGGCYSSQNNDCPGDFPQGDEPGDDFISNDPSIGSNNSQSPGQSGVNSQAPGSPIAPEQQASPTTTSNQPEETFIRADSPSQPTEFVKATHSAESPGEPNGEGGPRLITVLVPTKVDITQTRVMTV